MKKAANSEFVIEKGIPLAEWKRGRPAKYPFAKMGKGDSVLCGKIPRNRLTSAVRKVATKTGRAFAIRTTPDGIRVWRTK